MPSRGRGALGRWKWRVGSVAMARRAAGAHRAPRAQELPDFALILCTKGLNRLGRPGCLSCRAYLGRAGRFRPVHTGIVRAEHTLTVMRRFTDPILFFCLFLLSAITWAIMAWRDAIPAGDGRVLAPMTVAVVILIACPAFAFLTVLGLVRSMFYLPPRGYWSVVMLAAVTGAVVLLVTILITRHQNIELGFQSTMWFLAVVGLGSFVALLLSLIGAIPTPLPKEERKVAKFEARELARQEAADQKAAAKAEKAAQKEAKRAEKRASTDTVVLDPVDDVAVAQVATPDGETTVVADDTVVAGETVVDEDEDSIYEGTPIPNPSDD